MSEPTCLLLLVPGEMLAHICTFLPPASVCLLELSSTSVKEAVEQANVWREKVELAARLEDGTCDFVRRSLDRVKKNEFARSSGLFKTILCTKLKLTTSME